MAELLSVTDCESLSIDRVHELYREHVSRSQVSLIGSFGFGRDQVSHAEGVWIHLRDGSRVLDFTGGVGVLSHGHNHPRILAVRERFQRERRMEVHKNYFSPYVAGLSHNLAALLPGDLNVAYFPNSGAEAVEGAVKLAFKYHGGRRGSVLHSDIAFHGKLLGAASLNGSPEASFPFPEIPGSDAYRYGDIESFRLAVERHRGPDGRSDVYAVLVEPFSASSLQECSEEFLREVRRICTELDIVLVFDEVYTGWGKTGSLFHFMRHPGLVPDVVTMSKSFGGGKASISGYVSRTPIFRKAYDNLSDATLHSTTYYGFGEETVTAIEAVAIAVEEDFPARARRLGDRLAAGLAAIARDHPRLVDGIAGAGALHGVFLNRGPEIPDGLRRLLPSSFARDPQAAAKLLTGAVVADLYREHRVLTFFGSNRRIALIASPPLVAGDAEVDLFLDALRTTLAKGAVRLLAGFVKGKVTA
ncbi:aspartate aminotransferase family protein [Actinoplanes sp. CA-252034]|uniref:aspartate aminotransferase family protein n=1 Tax=Actinoplanes sp. CA-252034 TaxID=3239906 RepID=UPI003D95EDC5